MNDAVLSCDKLTKIYHQGDLELVVLDGLDFAIAPGESVAIIGASGSGKTTLLNLLGGIDRPTRGTVMIGGQDISRLAPGELDRVRNRTLGFVYQFHHLLGEFSAQENVAMPLIIAREDFDKSLERADYLLTQVGLGERLTHKPSQLSGGERQRVAIARAMANEPQCVLMDEPTGNLDRNTGRAIHKLMLDLKEKFTTSFVIVTHDPDLARQMDRMLLLQDGVLVPQQE